MTAPTVDVSITGEQRIALRILADWLIVPGASDAHLAFAGVSLNDVGVMLRDLVTHDDDCPECPDGTVIAVGHPEHDTGFQHAACDAGCGWTT